MNMNNMMATISGLASSATAPISRFREVDNYRDDDDDDDDNNNDNDRRVTGDDEDDQFDEDVDSGARRIQMLLAQYYGQAQDSGNNDNNNGSNGSMNNANAVNEEVFDPLNINSPHFNVDKYVQTILTKKELKKIVEKEQSLSNDIRRLDSDLQMLVYENYNKFITATDTIKKMKSHVESMEEEMTHLMKNMDKITDCSDAITANLSSKRERIDKLSSVSRMLKKMQFLLDLPKRLKTCLDMKTYAVAVKYYNMANKILHQYRHLASFQSIHKDSEAVITELKTILYNRVKMLPQIEKGMRPPPKNAPKKTVEYKKAEEVEAVTLLIELGEDWQQVRSLYTTTRKEFIDQVSRELPSNTSNIREFIDKLNENVINRAIDWIQIYFTAFHKLEKKNDTFFINWIGRDIFKSVYMARAREHLVDVLTTAQKQTDTDADLLVSNTQNAQDFRHAMFQMWQQVTSRVHILIPEAKLGERAGNLVSDTVRAFMAYEMNVLERSIMYRMSTFSKTNPASVKQDSELNDLLSKVGTAFVDDVKTVSAHFATLIDTEDDKFQILVSRKQVFHTWIQSSVMRVFEDVCTLMANRVMPHSQFDVHVGKEAEEASKLPEHKQKKASSASALVRKQQQPSHTPAGLLLVCRLSRDLSKFHLEKMKSLLEKKFPIRGNASLFDVSHLGMCLKKCAQQFLVGYIETQGQRLNKFIRTGLESHDWLNDSDVVRGVRHGIVSVVKEMSEISDFVNRVFPMKSTMEKKKRNETSSFSYASMAQSNDNEIVKDVMKIFNKKASTFRIKPPVLDINVDVNPASILLEIMKIALKTFEECVRMYTFGKDGFQQLQVDAHFLKVMWSKLIDDEKVITSLVNEAMSSCAERCLELSPLDQNIVQTLVDKKIAQLQEKQ